MRGYATLCVAVVNSPDPKGHVSYCHHLASVVHRKLFQKSSPLKVLHQWKPNLVRIITRVSSFKIVSGDQGLKLRKYFRSQVGPYQINFGSPHNLLGVHQACIARLPSRLRGALWQVVRGPLQAPRKPWDKWCKILHSGHFLAAKLAIQKL